jgi:DNA adenine methylase
MNRRDRIPVALVHRQAESTAGPAGVWPVVSQGKDRAVESSRRVTVPHPIPYQGSKRRLAPAILEWLPEGIETLYEPFAGSAAVSLAMAAAKRASRFEIADSLAPLAELWRAILDEPEDLIAAYAALWNEQMEDPRTFYDRVRADYNVEPRSDRLLFLLARCVKNAVRFNDEGGFNQSPDKRRLGTQPRRMAEQIRGARTLLGGRTGIFAGDYRDATRNATPRDLVYLDPPYQGTSGARDRRYHQQLDFEAFVAFLRELEAREVPFVVSFDGRTGDKRHGRELPDDLGLTRVDLDAGRSSQATLNGRDERTYESLYVPRMIASRRATGAR